MLKVDKKGNILRPNGTVLGAPEKTGNIYRSNNKTGRIDLATGDVFDLKEQLLGKVDVEKFEIFKESTLKDSICKTNEKKEIATPKSSKKSKEKSKSAYVPGLDSELIVSGRFSKMMYKTPTPTAEEKALEEINKKHGWKHIDWDDLSCNEDLTDSELEKYETYVNWYVFLSSHPDREFNDAYEKKFKSHLILRSLGLIPYNGSRASKPEEYKASSIKEDREHAAHIKELKAKREARKKIREEE